MKRGKKEIFFCALFYLVMSATLSAQSNGVSSAPINDLGAIQSGGSIRVSWRSGPETGVTHYALHRSNEKTGPFTCVLDNISCLGNYKSYSFDDNCDLFKAEGNFLFYKVMAVYEDGSIKESETISAYYNSTSSAAKRTWGSIKAMFR